MEPFSLAGIAIAIGSGMLAKAGEDSFDALKGLLQYKLMGTPTAKALSSGEELDPQQVTIDVEAVAADPEVEKLRAQIEELVKQNEDLKQQFLAAQQQVTGKNVQINRDESTGFQTNVDKGGTANVAQTINIYNQDGH